MKIPGLALSYSFVEYRVVAVLIDVITNKWNEDNLRKAAVITTLQDGLSSIFVICTHVLEAKIGRFSVIISCTATYGKHQAHMLLMMPCTIPHMSVELLEIWLMLNFTITYISCRA